VMGGGKNGIRNMAIQACYPVASLCSRCDRTADHSPTMMLYTQASRNVSWAPGRLISSPRSSVTHNGKATAEVGPTAALRPSSPGIIQ
jgi:hypothetical protein